VSALARSIGTGKRRVVGAALDAPDTVVVVMLLCSCGRRSQEVLALDEPVRAQLASVSCGSCGRLGQMRLTQPVPR